MDWRHELYLWYAAIRAQVSGDTKWYKIAEGLSKLKIHCEVERAKMYLPYGKERTLWIWVVKRDKNICWICDKYIYSDVEVDHKYPVILGGYSIPSNLAAAHKICNRRKGAKVYPTGFVADPYSLPWHKQLWETFKEQLTS